MRAWYNENDPFAAAWLRELQRDGEIADGRIDERSIVEIDAGSLAGYVRCHFFAGIGGWDYALQLAGWPDARPVWTGSCPCQPFSAAGKQGGSADKRHLWPSWLRLIRECRPDTLFGEQVEGAVGFGWIDRVFADLEAEGYACGAAVLGAHSVGAPHIRQRLYWVADADGVGSITGRRNDGEMCRVPKAQCEPEHSAALSGRGSADGRLADAMPARRTEGRAIAGNGQASSGGWFSGVAHTAAPRQQPARQGAEAEAWNETWLRRSERGCTASGLEIASIARLEGSGERTAWPVQPAPWTASVAIPCADGKFRRVPANGQAQVESSLFPLAHGVPNRMGALRGAGNAICPQTAAEFVAAFLDESEGGMT